MLGGGDGGKGRIEGGEEEGEKEVEKLGLLRRLQKVAKPPYRLLRPPQSGSGPLKVAQAPPRLIRPPPGPMLVAQAPPGCSGPLQISQVNKKLTYWLLRPHESF